MKIDFTFYAITDRKRMAEELFLCHIEHAFANGLRAIQVREKDLSPVELFRLCEQIKKIADHYDVKVFINDRADVMQALDLHGVHLTEQSLSVEPVRKIIGKEKLIGVSVHSAEGLRSAAAASADFAVFGPVAPTQSKPPGHWVLAAEEFKRACAGVKMPVFALGGISADTVRFWIEQGAQGVAGISIWMETPDIAAQIKQLEKLLGHL